MQEWAIFCIFKKGLPNIDYHCGLMHSFIKKYLLSTYNMPGTVTGTKDITGNKTNKTWLYEINIGNSMLLGNSNIE